jgi:hypothetical protein
LARQAHQYQEEPPLASVVPSLADLVFDTPCRREVLLEAGVPVDPSESVAAGDVLDLFASLESTSEVSEEAFEEVGWHAHQQQHQQHRNA